MSLPMSPYEASSVIEASMISFWTAATLAQVTMKPEFFTQFAPATKQASSGPKDVANMPAPQGQCMLVIFKGLPKLVVLTFLYTNLSILSMFEHAITASS